MELTGDSSAAVLLLGLAQNSIVNPPLGLSAALFGTLMEPVKPVPSDGFRNATALSPAIAPATGRVNTPEKTPFPEAPNEPRFVPR